MECESENVLGEVETLKLWMRDSTKVKSVGMSMENGVENLLR